MIAPMKKKNNIIELKFGAKVPGLKVKCKHCDTWVNKCHINGKNLSECERIEDLVYLGVVHISGTKNGRKIKVLGKKFNNAIAMLASFREEVQNGMPQQEKSISAPTTAKEERSELLLIHAFARYMAYLKNDKEVVAAHLVRPRSAEHVKNITLAIENFCICLKRSGIDIDNFKLSSLSDREVGLFHSYLLETKKFSNRSYNKYFSYFTTFITWCNSEGHDIKNVFEKAPRKAIHSMPVSISDDEFYKLLSLVTHDNGFQHYPGKVKDTRNIFRDYLVPGYKLGILTGRRREEIISMRYDSIKEDENQNPVFIEVIDFKVSRIQNLQGNEKRVFVPVTRQLRDFLYEELEYEKHRGSSRFLLAPDVTTNRVETIGDALSRSFSHYYKQLNTGKDLSFKSLRKTYLSNLEVFLQRGTNGIETKDISGHSSPTVLSAHYLDPKLLASSLQDFEIFPDRKSELERARAKTKPEKTIER